MLVTLPPPFPLRWQNIIKLPGIQEGSPANGTSATITELMSGSWSSVLLSPGPHQAFPSPHGFPFRSCLFLAFARSLSKSGVLAVVS